MTTADAHEIRSAIADLSESVATVERLQRETNQRLGKLESRVWELELWRARWQGAATTSRGIWLVAGGAVTAVIIEMFRNV